MALASFTQSGFEAFQGILAVADLTIGNAFTISATKQFLPATTGTQDIGSTTLRIGGNYVTNIDYSGTLTGGTGIVNLGSGQFYKDASGNVGIGTVIPGAPLHVQKTLAGALLVSLENLSNSASANARFLLKNDTGTTAGIQFWSSAATTPNLVTLYNSAAAALAFSTTAVERGRFTATGEFIIGNGDTSATPTAGTFRGTDGVGTNIAGASVTIRAGGGTGTGTPGSLIFQTSTAGTTGTTLQTATTRLTISPTTATFTVPVYAATTSLAGNGDTSATPTAGTFRGTDGTGTNIAGANLTVQPGRGTGTGTPGTGFLSAATVGTTGATLQTASNIAQWSSAGLVVVASGAGLGYGTGSGGTVTQATSRTTGVTLNKTNGAITLFSTTTTAGSITSFTLTNSTIAASDVATVCVKTATGNYSAFISAVAAGSCQISLWSPAAVAVAEAPVLNFAVIKAVNA